MNNDLHFSSKRQDWETPQDLFDRLNEKYQFTLDLAASKDNTKCESYFTEETNSLDKHWFLLKGWLWLNPPYGREVKDWVNKCNLEAELGAKIIALLPARVDTLWYHNYIYRKYYHTFLKGRLKFEINGEKTDPAPFPSMIVKFERNILLDI
jgi:site-specific DNA-methyltransferase (adenine-specific)